MRELSSCAFTGYDGTYRGVYFTPCLPDGEFRQFAVFPLALFSNSEDDAAVSAAAPLQPALTTQVWSIVLNGLLQCCDEG